MAKVNPNLKFLANNYKSKRGVVLEGGSRSGKTYASLFFIVYLCSKVIEKGTINIVKETYNSFKTTLYDDFNRILPDFGIYSPFADKKEVDSFKIHGVKINLLGADKPSKFHGASCDYLYINEALDVSREVFDQAEMRCRNFWWMDYNPKYVDHWIYDSVVPRPDVSFLKTTLLQNPHISPAEKNKILSYNPDNEDNVKAGTADEYNWKVYGLGERAAQEGLVFKDVTFFNEWPDDIEKVYFGTDFGYVNDETAIVKCGIKGNELYIKYLFYQPIPNITQLIPVVDACIGKEHYFHCDSADPAMIRDLRSAGFKALAAKKFHGSIEYGIQLINSFKIHMFNGKNERTEQSGYMYQMIEGKALNTPVDKHNHGWDACFRGDTLIKTIDGYKQIKDIKIGDLVATSKGYNKVLHKHNNGVKKVKLYIIVTDYESISIICTQDHKIKTSKGWIPICDLVAGMEIYTIQPNQKIETDKTVRVYEYQWKDETVYDLTVDKNHEYFANGLLVHNCRYALIPNVRLK